MGTDDEKLKSLFREGRSDDREAVPDFSRVWLQREAPANDNSPRRARWLLVVAAVVIAGGTFAWFDNGTGPPHLPSSGVAQTKPKPTISKHDGGSADAELVELAAWEADAFSSPTDYLLEQQGTLSGGFPSGFDDEVFDTNDLEMEL